MTGGQGDAQQLLSDLFHALNQPLTTLRCSLELALARGTTVEKYRQTTENALLQAEHITRLTGGIRELIEAGNPGEKARILALDILVRDTMVDWLPMAESAGITFSLRCNASCSVSFDPQRLTSAWFHIMEFLLNSAVTGSVVTIEITRCGDEGVISATLQEDTKRAGVGEAKEQTEPLMRRLGLGIARRIFLAAGGTFRVARGGERLSLVVRVPTSPTEACVSGTPQPFGARHVRG